MKFVARSLCLAVFAGAALAVAVSPARAQKAGDPNLNHFYMARQQIQILDDAPAVNDMRSQPAAAAQGGLPPNLGRTLPRATWQPYSSSVGSLSNGGPSSSLPKVVNGVPPKDPPAMMAAPKKMKATAKPKGGTVAPPPPTNNVPKTYAPYAGYGGNKPEPVPTFSNNTQSSGNVRGRLLHWNRTRRNP